MILVPFQYVSFSDQSVAFTFIHHKEDILIMTVIENLNDLNILSYTQIKFYNLHWRHQKYIRNNSII